MLVGLGLVAVIALLAIVVAIVALTTGGSDSTAPAVAPATDAFAWVDPKLPAVPAGPVKKFTVDVYHHVTKVADGLAPTEVWSFSVNGKEHRGTGVSAPMSIWSAFHVIGTVFDKTHTDNGVAHDVQTINLAPSQGGWVEFTLDEEGGYPFVTHAFGDAVKGAIGVLQTKNAPKGAGHDMGGSAGHGKHAN